MVPDALLSDLRSIGEIALFFGGAAAALAYFLTRVKGGVDKAEGEALVMSRETNAILRQRVDDLNTECKTTAEKLNQAEGKLQALQAENENLRSLIMGEKVPEALANYFNDTFSALLKRIETSERVIVGAMQAQVSDFKDALDEKFHQLEEEEKR